MIIKSCTKCGKEKFISEFLLDKRRKDGHTSWCRSCMNENVLKWQKENKEKLCDKSKRYYRKNTKKCRERSHKHRIEHYEQYCDYYKKRRIQHPEKYRSYSLSYRNTIHGKLHSNLSTAIWRTIKNNKFNQKWESLVGYTIFQLKVHLEKHFKEGMTWDNYGTVWEIDHKIPVSVFNFEKPEDVDFRICWSLKNLQPLEVNENRRKNAKLSLPFQPSLRISV